MATLGGLRVGQGRRARADPGGRLRAPGGRRGSDRLAPCASDLRALFLASEMTLRMNVIDSFILFGIADPAADHRHAGAVDAGRPQDADYAIFVVVGSGMTGLWSSLLFISGNSITLGALDRHARDAGRASPRRSRYIVFGKNLANVLQSLLSMVGELRRWPPCSSATRCVIEQPLLFAVSLVLTVFAFVVLRAGDRPGLRAQPGRPAAGRTPWSSRSTSWAASCSRSPCCRAGRRPSATCWRPTGRPAPCTAPPVAAPASTNSLLSWGMMPLFGTLYLVLSRTPAARASCARRGPMPPWDWSSAAGADGDGMFRTLRVNARLFLEGALLSYIALFRWLRPMTYLASKIVMPLAQILFFTFLGIYASGRRERQLLRHRQRHPDRRGQRHLRRDDEHRRRPLGGHAALPLRHARQPADACSSAGPSSTSWTGCWAW